MTDTIKFDVDSDGIATLTIDLPDHSMNVFNVALITDLETCIDKVLSDDAIKGAIITSGKASGFLAGADLSMLSDQAGSAPLTPEEAFERSFALNKILRKMETGGKTAKDVGKTGTKTFVAAVNGLAFGGGLELILACHHRIVANDNPRLMLGFPEVLVGLLPGAGGTQRLPRLMGQQMALQYLSSGKNMNPMEALGFKVVQELAPTDELLAKAKEHILKTPTCAAPWDKRGFKTPGGSGAMHPGSLMTFMGANGMGQGLSNHNFPAIPAILSCVFEGGIVPFDTAIRIESKYFTKLMNDPVSGNMIRTLFINKQAAEKGARRPKGIDKAPVKKLGMLGAGLMGAGVAYVSAKAGMEVILLDRDMESAEKGKAYSQRIVDKGVKRGKVTADKGQALMDRITPTADYADLAGCDLIIEAVFEDPGVKKETAAKTEAVVGADTIFGSNTSTLPITDLQQNWSKPENFVGIHFFSPVDKMPLVEIIVGKDTGDKAIAKAMDYVAQIKKTPIVVNDSRGFYTSRSFGTYIQEGYSMIAEGVNPALIDNAGKMLGMAIGPLAVGDEVAIDLAYKVGKATREALGDAYVSSPAEAVVEKFVVDLERFGRKNGKGMYVYPEDGSKKYLWPGIADHFPRADEQPTVDQVKQRLLYRMIVECARCFEEGVLETAADGDLGAIFGWGFAPWTGGPFSHLDTVGIAHFVSEADRLAETHGEGFRPPQLLRDMAESGETFHGGKAKAAA